MPASASEETRVLATVNPTTSLQEAWQHHEHLVDFNTFSQKLIALVAGEKLALEHVPSGELRTLRQAVYHFVQLDNIRHLVRFILSEVDESNRSVLVDIIQEIDTLENILQISFPRPELDPEFIES